MRRDWRMRVTGKLGERYLLPYSNQWSVKFECLLSECLKFLNFCLLSYYYCEYLKVSHQHIQILCALRKGFVKLFHTHRHTWHQLLTFRSHTFDQTPQGTACHDHTACHFQKHITLWLCRPVFLMLLHEITKKYIFYKKKKQRKRKRRAVVAWLESRTYNPKVVGSSLSSGRKCRSEWTALSSTLITHNWGVLDQDTEPPITLRALFMTHQRTVCVFNT